MSDLSMVCVAIDFGTTYSGYAFSTKEEFERDPMKISGKMWPDGNGFSRKAPTVLLLNANQEFEAFGFEAEELYNQLVVEKEHNNFYLFRRFKMKLHGEKVVKNDFTLDDETGKKLKAEKVFAESIRYLKNHSLKLLIDQGKVKNDSEVLYILTVPAIWNDSSKQFMRNVAEKGDLINKIRRIKGRSNFNNKYTKMFGHMLYRGNNPKAIKRILYIALDSSTAGIDGRRLKIALEPEAAAFFCQYEKTERSNNTFATAEINTKYMVVDLGGGTVDIALHKKLENNKIQELYQASGGPYGGTYIDEAFMQLLIRAFGGPMMYHFREENTSDFLDFMKDFEMSKRKLKPTGRFSFNIRLPSSFDIYCKEHNGETLEEILSASNFPFQGKMKKVGDKLTINKSIILEMFSSVTTNIINIIQNVLSQPAAEGCGIILLVGGFAESEIVQDAIKDKFESGERRIIIPDESGLTVLKGATIFGHMKDSGLVTERVTRYTYGIATARVFDIACHNPDFKYQASGKYFVKEFDPFMEKGTSVKVGAIVQKSYHYDEFTMDSGITVYSTTKDVKFIEEGGFQQLINITVGQDAAEYIGKRVDIDVSYTFGDTELEVHVLCQQTGRSFRANIATDS